MNTLRYAGRRCFGAAPWATTSSSSAHAQRLRPRAVATPSVSFSSAVASLSPSAASSSRRSAVAACHRRSFSDSSSHDDFAPEKKAPPPEDAAIGLIESHIKANRVMLYMKGNPAQPMCGFSATVSAILKAEGADFASVNVLEYPTIREGVKKYAAWPTIPQLYVDGEFVGGCDVIKDMHERGELKEILAVQKEE